MVLLPAKFSARWNHGVDSEASFIRKREPRTQKITDDTPRHEDSVRFTANSRKEVFEAVEKHLGIELAMF